MTQRVAAKGNWNLGKGFSIYEIAGANAKISLQGDGVQSVTPTSITGLGYKINKQISVYGEFEMAQAYKVPDKKWDDFKASLQNSGVLSVDEYGMIRDNERVAVGVSGGKDSTAMLLRLIEARRPIDLILFCDTGLEFPQMYEHLKRLELLKQELLMKWDF